MRRGIRVRRMIRRFELWPVAKVAFFFHLLCYLLTVAIFVLVWAANAKVGTITSIEKVFQEIGFGDDFTIHGEVLLRAFVILGGIAVVIATISTVTLAFFYNGISMIMGGVVVSVLEERPRLARLPAGAKVNPAPPGPEPAAANDAADWLPHAASTANAGGAQPTAPPPAPRPAGGASPDHGSHRRRMFRRRSLAPTAEAAVEAGDAAPD